MSTNRLILFVAGGIFIVGLIVAIVFLNNPDATATTAQGSSDLTRETIKVYRSPT